MGDPRNDMMLLLLPPSTSQDRSSGESLTAAVYGRLAGKSWALKKNIVAEVKVVG